MDWLTCIFQFFGYNLQMMPFVILFLFRFNYIPSDGGETFFTDAVSPLSYIVEKGTHSRLLTFLADYKSFSLPLQSENKFGFGLLLSLRCLAKKGIYFTTGYSYYPKTERSKALEFLHLSLSYQVLKKPELNFWSKYGLNIKRLSFLPGNPYYSYRINSFHSIGKGLTLAYDLWKFKPYLNIGVSLSYLGGDFIEDIKQNKISYSRFFFLPKLELGFILYNFSFEFEYAKSPGFCIGLQLIR